MSNQSDHTIVRLRVPPELKKQIEEAAEHNNRSQSAEMVARLEKSFDEKACDYSFDQAVISDAISETIKGLIESLIEEGVENNKLSITLQKLGRKSRKAP